MELVERLRSEAEADEGLFLTRSAKLKREAADLLEEALKALGEIVGKFDACDSAVVKVTPLGINKARAILTKSRGEKVDG